MVASIGGDGAAHRQLLGRLSHLRAYFNRRLSRFGRSAAESDDLVQKALLAIQTSRHTYGPTSEPFTPWVHAIAHYKLIDHMRATRLADASMPIEDAEAIITDVDELAGAESGARADIGRRSTH